jgi:crotonobetainyl-CoA:carnitine CoA-transferase CaiB-like acyl-CoA transferase
VATPRNLTTFQLLAGTRVLDLTNSIAGPYATLLLADLGADVVKIERGEGGDDTREWGPPFLDGESPWFLSVNRNKRSVCLDYATDHGREVLTRMLHHADVLVTNARFRTQQQLAIDPDSLERDHPELVVCSITGFGITGDRRNDACYDLVAEGHSGIMDLTGEPTSPPQKIGTAAADLLAGMDAAFAIVAALLDARSTGRGHHIDVSLVESMTKFLTPRIVSYLGSAELPARSGGKDSVIAIYQTFDTRDRPMNIALGNDAIFRRFCVAIGRPEWASNRSWQSNEGRRRDRAQLQSLIARELSQRDYGEWHDRFTAAQVPVGPINTLEDVARDPAFRERGLLFDIDTPTGRVPQVGTGWLLDRSVNTDHSPPPRLGEHTVSVLREWAHLADDDLETLSALKVIA